MKLSTITEGFRYRTNMAPDEVEAADYQLIRQKGHFTFSDTDQPQDFIHVQEAMVRKDLPIKPSDPKALSTFQDASIWYGFTLVEPTTFQSTAINVNYPRADAILLVDAIRRTGWPPADRDIEIDSVDSLRRLRDSWVVYTQQANPDLGHSIDEYQEIIAKINQLLQQLETTGAKSINGYLRQLGTTDTANKERTKKHLNQLQIAFAKTVKEPQTDNELEIATQFAEMAVDLFNNVGPKDYTVVVYPKSSREFNKDMANSIAKNLGSSGAIEIDKIKAKDITFSRDEAVAQARKMAKTGHHRLKEIGNTMYTDPSWPEKWADEEISKLQAGLPTDPEAEASIKTFNSGDKRRYIQLFGLDEPELYGGETILIVDDNVQHQGTFEMLHVLLNAANPARIDMYTPLWLQVFK